ncbi:hypothetical protein GO613_17950 [Azoarcus communis]|nr:hypothetical protein [Parazoarcus communis]
MVVITPFRSRLDGGMLRREACVCRKESERAVHRICLDGWRATAGVGAVRTQFDSCLNLLDARIDAGSRLGPGV